MADLTTVATNLGREATAKARTFADTNPVAKKAKDAVYTAVGFGVLGAQKATQAFKSVQDGIDTDGVSASVKRGLDDVAATVKRQAAWVDGQFEKTIKTIDDAIAPVEQKLPSPVRDAATRVREARSKARSTITSKVNAPADSAKK